MNAPAGAAPAEQAPPLRGLLSAGLDALRTRLDLAAVELEIHLLTLLRMLVCVMGAVACALLAFAFGVTAMIVALWDTHRMLGLLIAVAVFIVGALAFAYFGVRTLRAHPGFLEGSLKELREDQRHAGDGS